MKKLLKLVAVLVCGLASAFGLLLLYMVTFYPDAGKPLSLDAAATPDRLARGKYIAESVAVCTSCHSDRDYTRWAGPVIPDTLGAGGRLWTTAHGVAGRVYAANITPSGLSAYSDGELAHAITTGVTRTGRAMSPLMPYLMYNAMCLSDLKALVAYLRAIKPLTRSTPASELDFPTNILVRMAPRPYTSPPCPDPDDELALGAYLTSIGACQACHTPRVAGIPDVTRGFAGGEEFTEAGGLVRAPNITPHRASGLGSWSRARFIRAFKAHGGATRAVRPGGPNTVMPWTAYAGMTERDLGAVWAYLRTVPPLDNPVERYGSAGVRE